MMRFSIWNRFSRKTKHLIMVVSGGTLGFAIHATVTGNPKFYRSWIMPTMRLFDAETSHRLAVKLAQYGLMPVMEKFEHDNLKCQVFGLQFSSPVGLAAGFDKHGEAMGGLLKTGFAFVEVGSVTPLPQPGNEKPRVFRLTEDGAIINRYGFNSDGHDVVHQRLTQYRHNQQGQELGGVVGVNLGMNKTSIEPVRDYVEGVSKFGDVADYLVVNISSPNTPGLRDMQGRKKLEELITKVVSARDDLSRRVPLLVKIAPDLSDRDKIDIAAVVARPGSGVDGLIVTNTTVSRPSSLTSKNKAEVGGLSGEPLREMSTQTIRDMYRLTHGRVPIIGVGGVSTGEDVREKLVAGASLVQLYSSLAYHGPPLVNQINRQLSHILQEEGLSSVSDLIGLDHKPGSEPR